MHTQRQHKSSSRVTRGSSVWDLIFTAVFLFAAAGTANAVPTGYNPDTGLSYFSPSDEVLGFELFDALEPNSSFGFFFQGDTSSAVTIFDSTDPNTGIGSQVAYIDFVQGMLWDVDSGSTTPETFFVPQAQDIGFYMTVGSATIYSDPLLNGGYDLFSAFSSMTENGKWLMQFDSIYPDGSIQPINLTLISGVNVPEPSMIALMSLGVPLMLVASRRRRRHIVTV